MDTALILARQILQMFLLAGLGYALFKTKKITQDGAKALGNILIYLALPSVIINGFLIDRTPEHITGMLYSAIGAAVLLLISILVSRFVFKQDAIAAFAGAFSNPGFFGIPLIIASVGQHAVFYVACFVAFLNIGQWTYGVSILTGQPIRQGFQLKKLIKAPFIIAILIGRYGYKMKLVTYTTTSANMMLREIGLVLFLASVGIKAGANFFDTVMTGDGVLYVLTGFLITIIPILIIGPIARRMKFNYFTIAGMLAGTYTDPPALAYANSICSKEAPAVGYSTVYPFAMFLRILTAQLIVLFCCGQLF